MSLFILNKNEFSMSLQSVFSVQKLVGMCLQRN